MKKAIIVLLCATLVGCAGIKAGIGGAINDTEGTVGHVTSAYGNLVEAVTSLAAIVPDVVRIALGVLKWVWPILAGL